MQILHAVVGEGGWEKKNKKTRVKVVVARKVVHCG
jgi:hypothetical protein